MSESHLGRLEQVDLRTVWVSESGNFTPWLARKENIALLGDAIGLELEVEAQEKSVGPFRADILCKDVGTDSRVLIENQLERTDHSHLGQLLTYAAGLETATIVWVAQRFTEEHRAALDWLNEITTEKFSFFGIEIELWKIGDSPPAPRFHLVSRPNEWSRSMSRVAAGIEAGSYGPMFETQVRFWTGFNEVLRERAGVLRPRSARGGDFVTFGTGTGGAPLVAWATSKRIACGVVLHPPNAKPLFRVFERQRAEIEAAFRAPLEWRELPQRKESQIVSVLEGAMLSTEADWPSYYQWLATSLEKLHQVFAPRLPAALLDVSREAGEE